MDSRGHDPQHARGDAATLATRTKTSSKTTTGYKPTIRYRGGTQYAVQSRTRPDHLHHVDTYRLTCTCEAGGWGKRCWAMAAALQFEAWRRHELAKAAAQPLGMAALQDAC
jgi:hypothetical protein